MSQSENARLRLNGVRLLATILACTAGSVVITPATSLAAMTVSHPSERVHTLGESAVLVFDPLARSQTTLIRWRYRGATRPFAVVIPVPENATVHLGQTAALKAFERHLHPVGRVRRDIQLQFKSWVGGCLVPEVGDVQSETPVRTADSALLKGEAVDDDPTAHEWYLKNVFTISAAQASWLQGLKPTGWRAVAVRFTPPPDSQVDDELTSPVVAITHRATQVIYSSHIPRFSLSDETGEPVPLEISVLTEWPVEITGRESEVPFISIPLSEKALTRVTRSARDLNWSFRRAGFLSGFRLVERGQGQKIRFSRLDGHRAIKPHVEERVRPVRIPVPLEIILLVMGLALWAWSGSRRGGRRRRGIR